MESARAALAAASAAASAAADSARAQAIREALSAAWAAITLIDWETTTEAATGAAIWAHPSRSPASTSLSKRSPPNPSSNSSITERFSFSLTDSETLLEKNSSTVRLIESLSSASTSPAISSATA